MELDEMMLDPTFWDDQQAAQVVINESNQLKSTVNEYKELVDTHENIDMTLELLREEQDDDLQEELGEEVKAFKKSMEDFELQMLLSDPYDANNAIFRATPRCWWYGVSRLGFIIITHVYTLG